MPNDDKSPSEGQVQCVKDIEQVPKMSSITKKRYLLILLPVVVLCIVLVGVWTKSSKPTAAASQLKHNVFPFRYSDAVVFK